MDDPELQELIRKETDHYLGVVDLIAAHNAPTRYVRSNDDWGVGQFRSAEGLVGHRPYAGTYYFDAIESLAIQRACSLFHAEHCNVQPVSGSMANMAVYRALLNTGDIILSLSMKSGGHLTHGHQNHFVRQLYRVSHYEVDPESYLLDYDRIRELAIKVQPKLIITGYSAYPRAIDFHRFKEIGDEVGAYVMADISHIAGLVATGLHMNPCESGLIVTSSVEKTLRGTRGGFVLCPRAFAKKIDSGVFPGLQSSIGLDSLITKARLFLEAQTPEFHAYQRSVMLNAKLMAEVFAARGISVLTGGTDTHMVILNVKRSGLSGREAEKRLEQVGILSNRNMIPFDPLPPFEASGLRLGTAPVTARGYETHEIQSLTEWIADVILLKEWSDATISDFRGRVARLVNRVRERDSLQDLTQRDSFTRVEQPARGSAVST